MRISNIEILQTYGMGNYRVRVNFSERGKDFVFEGDVDSEGNFGDHIISINGEETFLDITDVVLWENFYLALCRYKAHVKQENEA